MAINITSTLSDYILSYHLNQKFHSVPFSSLFSRSVIMFNFLKSSFTTIHRKMTSKKPLFQKTLNNHNLPSFTNFNPFELLFMLLDSNGDGKISAKELTQLLHRLGHEKLKAAKEAQEMMKDLDSDCNGFVDMGEFLGAFKEEDDEDILKEAFLIFDIDKNGLICAAELRRILSKLGWRKYGFKDCKRMIEGVDKDGDGFVNFEDFRLMMKAKDNGLF